MNNIHTDRRRAVAAYPYHIYLSDTHVVEVKKGGQYIGIYLITPTARRRGVVLPLAVWVALQNSFQQVNYAVSISQGVITVVSNCDDNATNKIEYVCGDVSNASTVSQGQFACRTIGCTGDSGICTCCKDNQATTCTGVRAWCDSTRKKKKRSNAKRQCIRSSNGECHAGSSNINKVSTDATTTDAAIITKYIPTKNEAEQSVDYQAAAESSSVCGWDTVESNASVCGWTTVKSNGNFETDVEQLYAYLNSITAAET